MPTKKPTTHQPIIIAHGGAWEIPEGLRQDASDGCAKAAAVGWEILSGGGSALDAVEATVRVLENDPTFDAGKGSVLNAEGEIELDAIMMDGRTLDLGAVMAVKHVCHPITLARLVMTNSEHSMLAAEGAETFARRQGVDLCPTWQLVVDREADRWHEAISDRHGPLRETTQTQEQEAAQPGDTVGAVALDEQGHVAAATSTGGTFNKHPGRVGDSPLVGCGAYADDRVGAVSATGQGEHLMRIVISKSACDFLSQGMTAQQAADASINLLAERTDGRGGIVVLGRQGDVGLAHNTGFLAHSWIKDGNTLTGIRV